ncbi:hypothetical protein [Massilia brevitalea]|uniref:hypothetical protein n=1 Tax=Massilia brevitalea TaxID=442526 RepID=UPI002738B59A|nr:hypothetical protein [Massilia brevitalea]
MRSDERRAGLLVLPVLHELADYLERTGSILSPDEALGHAVREWIASREDGKVALDVGAAPRRPGGYQWKCLFLAHGSELRFFHDGQFHYAEVRDDLLVHNNRPVSPRQFMLGVIGEPRNAWHELWVRRPSDARWKLASVLRRELASGKPPPESPIGAMREVAAAMAQTLETANAVVKKAQELALPQFERRRTDLRRSTDRLVEEWLED